MDITRDSERQGKLEEYRRTATRIDMTVENNTESRSLTHTGPAMNTIEIIELNKYNN